MKTYPTTQEARKHLKPALAIVNIGKRWAVLEDLADLRELNLYKSNNYKFKQYAKN